MSSAPETTVQETQTEIPTIQPKIPSPDTLLSTPSPQATPGYTQAEQTLKRSSGLGRHQLPKRLVAFVPWLTFPPICEDIPPRSKSVPLPPRPNILTTQPKMPSLNTPMPAPSVQTKPGYTGPEQTSKRSYGLGSCHQLPNLSDDSSSWPTFPPKSDDIPPRLKSVPPPPSPNMPERRHSSPKPGPPRDITPLSNIGMSL